MTANERLEALLNRAGQTLTDLPETHPMSAFLELGGQYPGVVTLDVLERILHLTDVIDRMETALENAVPIKPLAKWLAGYSFPPDEIAAERWEEFLRGMDWGKTMRLIDEMSDIALRGVPEEAMIDAE